MVTSIKQKILKHLQFPTDFFKHAIDTKDIKETVQYACLCGLQRICLSTHLWCLFKDIGRVGEVGRQTAGRGRRGGRGLRAPSACRRAALGLLT